MDTETISSRLRRSKRPIKISAAILLPFSMLSVWLGGVTTAYATSGSWTDITGNSFTYPYGVAVDSAGDLFVTDATNNTIKERSPGSSTWTYVPNGGLNNSPTGIAVNSAGDLFVANFGDNTIEERPSGSSTWTYITNGGLFSLPVGIAADGAGDVYVTNSGDNTLEELPRGSHTWQVISNGGPFGQPYGVAVDSAGDLFVTDAVKNAIEERPSGSSTWTDVTNGGSFDTPVSIAVDSAGDLIVTNRGNGTGNGTIEERISGSTTWTDITNGWTFGTLTGIAVNTAEQLFITNGQKVIQYEIPPKVPTGLMAGNIMPTGTSLTWNTVAGASSYNVYENGDLLAANVAGSSYAVNNLLPGAVYAFTVSAVNAGGESTQSSGIPVWTVPSMPTGLAFGNTTATGTLLAWNPVAGAASYNVYERGKQIASDVTGTGYTVSNLTPGTTYSFTVSAVDGGGESAQSGAVTVHTAEIGSVSLTASSSDVLSGGTVAVTGVVYDVNHSVVPNAAVELTSPIGWGRAMVTADVYGAFSTTWIAPLVDSENSVIVTAAVYGANVTPTTLSLAVAPPPSVATTTVADATEGSAYAAALGGVNGFPPYTWRVVSGSLPTGLTLDDSTGIISGTPTAAGTSSFTVQATDKDGNTATQNLSISVADTTPASATLVVNPGSITLNGTNVTVTPAVTVENAEGQTLSGSLAAGTFAVSAPAGAVAGADYAFDTATGVFVIEGTSTMAGQYTITYTNGTVSSVTASAGVTVSAGSRAGGGTSSGNGGSGGGSGGSSGGGTSSGSGTGGSGSTSGSGGSSSGGGSGGSSGAGSSGGGTGGSSTGSSGNTSPLLPTVVTSHTFGSSGGTVEQSVGNMSISINVPQGAFTQPEQLTVTTASPSDLKKWVVGPPPSSVALMLGVNFSGAAPTKPVTITIANPSIQADSVVYKLTSSGRLAPLKADVSAGQAVVSFTSDPDFVVLNVKGNDKVITLDGHASIVPAMVNRYGRTLTTYLPIWYVMHMLKDMGISSTWDGHNWHLTTGSTLSLGSGNPGHGAMHIYLNGELVQNVTGLYVADPSTSKPTTYMPVWYLMQVVKRLSVANSWDGTTWSLGLQGGVN